MNSNEKIKKILKIIIPLLSILLLLFLARFAYAKYTESKESTTTADIAKWSFIVKVDGTISENLEINLADTRTDNKSSVSSEFIAPDTQGCFNIELDASQSEVSLIYDVNINASNIPENLIFYSDSKMENALLYNNNIQLEGIINCNDSNKIISKTIYWKWPYETGTTPEEISANDIKDSKWMGIPILLDINITGTQIKDNSALQQRTATFNSNTGKIYPHNTEIATLQLIPNTSYGTLPNCVKEGYTFDGWFTSKTGGTKITESTKMPSNNVTYYAHWVGNPYIIEFDASGGTIDTTQKNITMGENYGQLPIPTKKGYTFDGWFTSTEDGEKITENTIVNTPRNHTLYARWTFNIYDLDPVVNVNTQSTESGTYFGGLYSTSIYTGSVFGSYGGMTLYSDNGGNLQYDTDGALLLDSNNALAVLDIDPSYNIGNQYSISTTLNGDVMQTGSGFPATIVAISGNDKNYLTWIGYYKGYLQVYSYYYGAAKSSVSSEQTTTGFASIDISSYANQTINLQITATKGGKTTVYINGNQIRQFDSGNADLSYAYLTIGDLRVGRSLKFTGKLYDFAIFDSELNSEEVADNYDHSKVYISD